MGQNYLRKIISDDSTYTCVITDANRNKVTTNPANLNSLKPHN